MFMIVDKTLDALLGVLVTKYVNTVIYAYCYTAYVHLVSVEDLGMM